MTEKLSTYCGNYPELDHTDCPSSVECSAVSLEDALRAAVARRKAQGNDLTTALRAAAARRQADALPWACADCDRSYAKRRGLVAHRKAAHPGLGKPAL